VGWKERRTSEVRKNQDPCQKWRNEIELLHQGISETNAALEEGLSSGEIPSWGREDAFHRLERLKRDLRHAQSRLEKCEDETRRD
jgi:hypothetical protein